MKNTSTLILRNSFLLLATLFTIFSLTATAQTKLAQARITQAIDESNLVTLRGSVHPLARAGFDQGAVADSRPMNHMLLVLQRSAQQETALRTLIDEQQTKNSPNYHTWLTPQQFGQQFGVADADVQKVAGWLSQQGFTEIKASNGNMFIEFNGTAGLVRNAFHTEIRNVMVNGQQHIANLTDPQIPAALAPVIARIHSLHDFRLKSAMRLSKSMQQLKAEGKLTKPAFGSGTGLFAVGPGDLATIYHIPATVAGSPAGQGQTIAIVARSNITISDVKQFGSAFGIPNLTNFSTSNIVVNGPDPGIVQGDDGEATLDVDMVGSTAPNANILLVVSGATITGNLAGLTDTTDGVDLSALYIVTNNLAPIMSQSFGACEAAVDTAFNSTLWEQGAAQGISIFVSTGDTGSAGCDPDVFPNASSDGLQISGSASTPFNIAVGGTDFNDASNPTTYWNDTQALATAKSYIPEIPWNSTCASTATAATLNSVCSSIDPNDTDPKTALDLSAGSGGQSNCATNNGQVCTGGYPKPSWQSAPGVPADGVRDIPDVSLFASVNSASGHFYVFCLADSGNQDPTQPCNLTGNPIVNGNFSYNFSGVGGTSASTPAWAGIMALVNQSEIAAGRSGRQGNANYVLYKLAANQSTTPGTSACNSSSVIPNSACTFNDITLGNNDVACVGSFATANGFGNNNNPNCSTQALNGLGVLVEPSSPAPFNSTTPGWTATAGYDLATGLGTPNVSNLIANWGSVTTNFKTATPAITSPATGTVSITHGNNQSFTITVTGAGGTPTGDISLIAEPPGFAQVGVGSATLVNGTATITTNMLPGDKTAGTATPYPVIAHYAGDGTFGPADSQPINVTVNRENSTTTATMFNEDIITGFLTPTTSVQYGTRYMMIVNVVGATAGAICNNSSPTSITQIPEVPCPTGNITLTENGNPLNDFIQTGSTNTNISSVGNLGFVEDLLIQLLGGTQTIVANYSGDNSYNSSASPAANHIAVTPGPTQSTVTVNGAATATATTGQSVTLVATVTTGFTLPCGNTGSGPTQTCPGASNGVGPTGTVTFSACGTAASCTVPVVPTSFNNTSAAGAFATGSLTTSFATAGPRTITATFTSGDLNYSSCTANGTPAGCSLTSLGLTVSGAVGAASKLAFIAQPSNVPVGVSISPSVQVVVEDINGNVVAGATNVVTIAIGTNPGTGTLGGTKTATPVNGVATFSNLTLSAAGTGYTLTAAATGLTGATSTAFNVIPAAAKLAFIVSPSNTNAGASIVPAVQVAIEDVNGSVVSGATNSITIAIGTNPGSGTLGGTATATPVNGVATFSNLSISAAGNGYTLTASATGLTGATSAAFNVVTTAAKLAFITPPPVNGTVAGKSIAPAVQVAIEDANGSIVAGATTPIVIAIGTNPGAGTLAGTLTGNPANGIATFSNLTISTAGNGYTLTATASGLTSATSILFNVGAPPAPSFTVGYSPQPFVLNSATGAASTLTVTVTPSGGFTGMVAVTPTAASLPPGVTCTPSPLNINVTTAAAATGQLMCSVTATSTVLTASIAREDRMLEAKTAPPTTGSKGWWTLSAGTGFAAMFLLFLPGGRKKYRAALGLGLVCILTLTAGCNGSGGGTIPPPKTATITKLTANTGKLANGTAFTFSAAVTGGTPTGMVQLFDGTTMIGTAASVAAGTAAPTAPALSVGTHAISAQYLGDATTKPSTSGTLNLTVTGSTTIAITSSPVATPAAPAINVTVQ